nr:hypothetical protein [Globicatella sulfidifaciens]
MNSHYQWQQLLKVVIDSLKIIKQLKGEFRCGSIGNFSPIGD